jgi:hypothetical protein
MTDKVTEHEMRMLQEALRENDHREGFRSYVVMGSGTKGGNFRRISLEKRAASLVRKGHLRETAHGYEVTETGRALVAPGIRDKD